MAGFDASGVVEPLDYSLRPHVDKAGTIREPNDRQIADFLSGVKSLVKKYRGQLPDDMIAGSANVSAMLSAMEDLDTEVTVAFNADMAALYADLCSGEPSKDDIMRLPPRIRAMFLAWVQKEVMSPEAAPGGGKAQVRTLRSAAAG